MTPQTNPNQTGAAPQRLQAPPWPLDHKTGAELILQALHALLTGPAAVAFLTPSAMGGANLDQRKAMDAAEAFAADAMARSYMRGGKA